MRPLDGDAQAFGDAFRGIQHIHVLARRHQRLHRHLVQVQAVEQHLLAGGIQHPGFGADVNDLRQFLVRQLRFRALGNGEQALEDGDDGRQDGGEWREQPHQPAEHRRGAAGHALGMRHGDGLGQDFGQDHHHHGHRGGGIDDACLAVEAHEDGRGQARCGDVHEVVANKDGGEHPLRLVQQLLGLARAPVALLAEQPKPEAPRPRQRRFRTGEEGREQQQKEQDADRGRPVQRRCHE